MCECKKMTDIRYGLCICLFVSLCLGHYHHQMISFQKIYTWIIWDFAEHRVWRHWEREKSERVWVRSVEKCLVVLSSVKKCWKMLVSVGQCERKLPRVCVCADRAACPLFPSWSAQKTPVALKLNSFLCPASSHPAENLHLGKNTGDAMFIFSAPRSIRYLTEKVLSKHLSFISNSCLWHSVKTKLKFNHFHLRN